MVPKAMRNRYVVEYRRLHDGADFEFSGVIGEEEGGSLRFRHRDIFSALSRAEISREGREITSLDELIRMPFGPLVSRTTTITSTEDLDTLFGQYFSVSSTGRGRRVRSR